MDIHVLALIAGKDYPRNWNAFLNWFSTEDACLYYLEKLRRPEVLIILAVEIKESKGFGRIRLCRIGDDTRKNMLPFIQGTIEPGSQVRTDGAGMYIIFVQHRKPASVSP